MKTALIVIATVLVFLVLSLLVQATGSGCDANGNGGYSCQ